MNNIALSIAAAALALGTIAIGRSTSSLPPNPPASSLASMQWEPYTGPPPIDWYLKDRKVHFKTLAGGQWNVAIESDFPAANVSVEWTYIPTAEVFIQNFPLSYWISALALDNDGGGFSVAGKRRNGNNVIDHYRMSPPPVPGSAGSTPGMGAVSVSNVYDAVSEGRDLICAMEYTSTSNHNEYIVQFYFSREINRLVLNSAGTVDAHLLASPDIGSTAAFHVPSLEDRPFFQMDTFKSYTLGTIFILKSYIKGYHTHIIVDADHNGTADTMGAIDYDDWGASPFADAGAYADY